MRKLLVIFSVLTLSRGQVEVRLPFGNPAGVTLTGAGFANNFAFQQQPEGQQPQQPDFNAQFQQQAQPQGQPQPNFSQFQQQPQPQGQPQPNFSQFQQQPQPQGPPQPNFNQFQPQQQPQQFPGPQPLSAEEPQPIAQEQPNPEAPPQFQQPQYAYAGNPAPAPAPEQYAQPAPVQPQLAYAAQAQPAQVHQYNTYAAAPAPLQYHRAVQYAPAPAVAVPVAPVAPVIQKHHQQYPYYQYYAAPAPAAVHQQIGYAATPVLTKVPGVADVPVTKLAYSQGFTQQEVDVHQPAVSTRKVKVRRPALRKEFYDIEHRVIVRPAGSATLELSQPISKEQQGPAVLTATKFAHIAPVVRYGAGRKIIDGDAQFGGAFGARNAGPAPGPEAQGPEPAKPQSATPRRAPAPRPQPPNAAQLRQAQDEDTEVVEAAPPQQGRDLQNEPQPIPEQPQQGPGPNQLPQQPPAPQGQENGRGIAITPDMPLALQNRLLELLTAKGGTVTEILNKDGSPADSASVLQVADALGDPSLQGGERITTRRIVVTRPIETIQEIEVQEPATKVHRKIVQQPALFKHHVPAVARVPVAVPAVKHVATPVVKTTYTAAHPAAYSFNYQAPQFSYSH